MAAGTQLHGHSRLDSLEQIVASNEECGGEIWELHDVLSNDAEDPATRAARKMDWSEFASALTERERAVIECIIEGRSLREVAKSFRVCDSTMQGDKRKLAVKIQDFMGVDILIEVRRSPRWKDDIMTSREQLACKHLRAH
jgi:ATP/maltotriose-dependent transcriptional regulator MalT